MLIPNLLKWAKKVKKKGLGKKTRRISSFFRFRCTFYNVFCLQLFSKHYFQAISKTWNQHKTLCFLYLILIYSYKNIFRSFVLFANFECKICICSKMEQFQKLFKSKELYVLIYLSISV
jgi:hypothetical protein